MAACVTQTHTYSRMISVLSKLSGVLRQVLRYYASHRGVSGDKGFVNLRRSDYIADGPTQFLLHGSPVINDCIYRHMHRFRHIIVIDFDEVCT